MKRKSLIITSIVSIIIISLMLLALTYGFYVTKISENENTKSIEVISGESKVIFNDLYENNSSELVEPGYEYIKVFTVKNTGNVKATYSVYLVDVINTFNRKSDITYTLYKTKGEAPIGLTTKTDFSAYTTVENGTFPSTSAVIATDESIENPNDIYTYVLKIVYENSVENQNEDQGKTFSAKVNIRGKGNDTNPYSEGTLAYSIFGRANSITEEQSKSLGYAIYTETLRTTITDASELDESLLLSTEDNNGQVYYYRGNVTDNYVDFAGMCWRIVNVKSDGTTKLILEDQDTKCKDMCLDPDTCETLDGNYNIGEGNFGYDTVSFDVELFEGSISTINKHIIKYLNPSEESEPNSMSTAFKNYQITLNTKISENHSGKTISDMLESGNWCYSDKAYADENADLTTATPLTEEEKISTIKSYSMINDGHYYYNTYIRLIHNEKASLKCDGTIMNTFGDGLTPMYVASLTYDELVFAGRHHADWENEYFLKNNQYLNDSSSSWWTITPTWYSLYYAGESVYTSGVDNDEAYPSSDVGKTRYFRPAVVLKNNVEISEGTGLQTDPYVVK